jgi:hypothetical protein
MPLQAQQILSLARQDARCPGFTAQSGQILNMVLSDLCQFYDFDAAKKTFQFNLPTSTLNNNGQAFKNLPTDYLRTIRFESFYIVQGVPYPMIHTDLEEFDMLVQQSNVSNFPVFFATDMSFNGMTNNGVTGVPVMLFWQIPSGAFPATLRYFSQMPDIATPETSTVIPWFPNQTYLRRRVAGELMGLTDDERISKWLGDSEDSTPDGAGVILRKYLQMQGDKGDRAKTVTLDRRRFGTSFDRLRNTKTIGW